MATEETVTSQAIAEVVTAQLAELLDCALAEVDLHSRITELPSMDSAKLVQVVVFCEKHWHIELDEDSLFDVRTGEELCLLVEDSLVMRGSMT